MMEKYMQTGSQRAEESEVERVDVGTADVSGDLCYRKRLAGEFVEERHTGAGRGSAGTSGLWKTLPSPTVIKNSRTPLFLR